MKTIVKLLVILSVVLSLISCKKDTPVSDATLKVSITDAPSDLSNVKEVWINFDTVSVSTSSSDTGWVNLSADGGTVNLLALTNAALQDLGVASLTPGHYAQIRFAVNSSWVILNDNSRQDATLNSNTVKLTKAFDLTEGITTELIVDFNVAHSLTVTNGVYRMTPVTRIVQKNTTGALSGKIAVPDASTPKIVVSAFKDGETTAVTATVAQSDGTFLLGYLEPGVYDIKIEADTYQAYDIADKTVTAGQTLDITGTAGVTLTQ
ncbi:MAG: hypothetical protein A2Y41_00180 [Spirochaetes bacterium GWB1_36_13]|nr:MAG: hypothetical protein A2Y41_00180 [Spirochaetes bacterium GWB1_36_13]